MVYPLNLPMYLRQFIFLIAITGILRAQKTNIEIIGNAPLLANTPVALTQYNDYITRSEVLKATQTIGGDGKFNLVVEGGLTGEYFLHIGDASHSILLEPGHLYNLEIPDPNGENLFYPTETDTNLLIYQTSNLDYQINYFTIYNYEDFANGSIRNKLKKFIDSMDLKYDYIQNPFFKQYKEYKLVELMSDASFKSQKTLYQTYLKGKPILYQHPQYMSFFNNFYTGIMSEVLRNANNSNLKNAIQNGTPIDTVLINIQRHEFGDDPRLAELICLKGLFELYYMPGYDKYKLENLVLELKAKSNTPEIKGIAEYFIQIISRMKPGSQYFNFEGKDTEGNIHALTEYNNKNMYLSFFSTDDAASIREITALKNIYDEYRKDINFITVCSSCTYASLQSFINEHKLKWTFSIIDPSVENEYEIITYPSAFLIDNQGRFVMSPGTLPTAGLSNQLYLFLKNQKQKNR
jgi:peroxiredoxin